MKTKYYTGIGSRETPENIREIIHLISIKLEKQGYTLRSGGANGADTFFEEKVVKKDIFIPWKNFNGVVGGIIPSTSEKSLGIIRKIHPVFDRLSEGAKKLHLRNINQVLGHNLDNPSSFLICWANVDNKGIPKGGTRNAWCLASLYEIPCFNLLFEKDLTRFKKYIYEE